MLKGFEHVGMTCSDIERTIVFYRDLLGLREVMRADSPTGVKVVFLDAGGGMLEIIQPPGPVTTPAAEPPRTHAGIRHFSLIVDDLDATYQQLSGAGVVFTELPRPARVAQMFEKVAFCKDPDGILVELIQRKS